MINYVGPYHSYPHYSMVDVFRGTLPPDTFRDKIVLVGGTALGIGDLRNTPFQKQGAGYMGVEVHANIIDNLLHSDEPHRTFLIRGFREELVDIGFIVLFRRWAGTLVRPLPPSGRHGHCHRVLALLHGVRLLRLCPLGPLVQLRGSRRPRWSSPMFRRHQLSRDF